MELISVIIPAFNESKLISKTLKCLQDQTYKNLEIVVVDDCSTDNTVEIVEAFASLDERIVLLKKATNDGPAICLNRGIEISKASKYIVRMDADDLIFPTKIERQYYYMESNPEIVCSGTASYYLNYKTNEHRLVIFPSNDIEIRKLLKFSDFIQSGTIIYKKDALLKVGMFDEKNPKGESMRMTLKLSKIGKLGNLLSPEYVYFTRKGEGNRSAEGNYKKRNKAYSRITRQYANEKMNITGFISSFGWSIYHFIPRKLQIFLRSIILSEIINLPLSSEELDSIEKYYDNIN